MNDLIQTILFLGFSIIFGIYVGYNSSYSDALCSSLYIAVITLGFAIYFVIIDKKKEITK
jgi:hypothetical protein